MPQRDFNVNLTNSTFPHNFDELGSTILSPTPLEQNRQVMGGFSGDGAEESVGVCQAYFMQNMLPTSRGYSSVSFLETLPPIPGLAGVPDDFYVLRGTSNSTAIFVPTTEMQYLFDPTVGAWGEFSIGTLAPDKPTVSFVKQRSFVFYPNIGCYEYNFEEQEFQLVELLGLSVGNILGICSAGSVLVAWDSTTVYWSSVLDPLDFVPSLSNGAGSTNVLAVKGEIITCYPLGQNFVIYTATNAVGARQSGNVQLPFTFAEISGSEGIASSQHVAYDSNQGVHITWTASGFQQVSLDQAGYIWPEFSDGVIRAIYSDYDENFNRPVLRSAERLELKLNFISNRWVGVSVKDFADVTGSYTFAMIYDTSLQRWGRLDVLHRDLIEFVGPNISRSRTYQELADEFPLYEDLIGVPYSYFAENKIISSPQSGLNFGVALSNGSIFRAALYQTGLNAETAQGIIAREPRILLGKFKIFRTSGAMLHSFKVQRLEEGVQIRAHLHSYTGQLVGHKVGFVENVKHSGHFLGRANADSFTLEFKGKFHLTGLVCSASDAGKRNQRGVALQEEILCVRSGSGECVVVTDGSAELCVVVGTGEDAPGNVGSKYELQQLYNYGLTLVEENYSEETWLIFSESMAMAADVLGTIGTTQNIIDAAYLQLELGIGQLESNVGGFIVIPQYAAQGQIITPPDEFSWLPESYIPSVINITLPVDSNVWDAQTFMSWIAQISSENSAQELPIDQAVFGIENATTEESFTVKIHRGVYGALGSVFEAGEFTDIPTALANFLAGNSISAYLNVSAGFMVIESVDGNFSYEVGDEAAYITNDIYNPIIYYGLPVAAFSLIKDPLPPPDPNGWVGFKLVADLDFKENDYYALSSSIIFDTTTTIFLGLGGAIKFSTSLVSSGPPALLAGSSQKFSIEVHNAVVPGIYEINITEDLHIDLYVLANRISGHLWIMDQDGNKLIDAVLLSAVDLTEPNTVQVSDRSFGVYPRNLQTSIVDDNPYLPSNIISPDPSNVGLPENSYVLLQDYIGAVETQPVGYELLLFNPHNGMGRVTYAKRLGVAQNGQLPIYSCDVDRIIRDVATVDTDNTSFNNFSCSLQTLEYAVFGDAGVGQGARDVVITDKGTINLSPFETGLEIKLAEVGNFAAIGNAQFTGSLTSPETGPGFQFTKMGLMQLPAAASSSNLNQIHVTGDEALCITRADFSSPSYITSWNLLTGETDGPHLLPDPNHLGYSSYVGFIFTRNDITGEIVAFTRQANTSIFAVFAFGSSEMPKIYQARLPIQLAPNYGNYSYAYKCKNGVLYIATHNVSALYRFGFTFS